jgi:hypothetical protein
MSQLCFLPVLLTSNASAPAPDGAPGGGASWVWGECCKEYGVVPKPWWYYAALTVPVELLLVGAGARDDGTTGARKTQRELFLFAGITAVNLVLIAVKLSERSSESGGYACGDAWSCYQGAVFKSVKV